ncbi:MAG: STAS/SEC14 domain-containing protein [Methylomicrobium sp.]
MLKVHVDPSTQTVLLEPEGPLSPQEFEYLAQRVDPLIKESGDLNGVLVHARQFPGWDSWAAFMAHLRFIKQHHRQVKKVALSTNSPWGRWAAQLASHWLAPQIKIFPYEELAQAQRWIES